MAQGNYDHPSYITRQQTFLGKTTAGSGGTSLIVPFPSAARLRQFSAYVNVTGSTGSQLVAYNLAGTTTTALATLALGSATATAGSNWTSADPNASIPAGSILFFVNGTETAGVYSVTIQHHLDALLGTWSAP